jgi:hypothetical protein
MMIRVVQRGTLARTIAMLTTAAMFAGTGTGCSLLFVKAPRNGSRSGHIDCTTSNFAPGIDTLVVGWQIARIIIAARATDADYQNATVGRTGDLAIGAGLLGLFGVSAVTGFAKTSDCREALREEATAPPPRRLIRRAPPPSGNPAPLRPSAPAAPATDEAAAPSPTPAEPTTAQQAQDGGTAAPQRPESE